MLEIKKEINIAKNQEINFELLELLQALKKETLPLLLAYQIGMNMGKRAERAKKKAVRA